MASRRNAKKPDRKKPRGKPFAKGNPGGPGRPKLPKEIKDLREAYRNVFTKPAMLMFMKSIEMGTRKGATSADRRVGNEAAKIATERGWGRVPQPVEITGAHGEPVEVSMLTRFGGMTDAQMEAALGFLSTLPDAPRTVAPGDDGQPGGGEGGDPLGAGPEVGQP